MNQTIWLARRAVLAIALMVAFYALAVTLSAILLWIPYAEWKYLDRVDLRLGGFCVITALGLLVAVLPRPDRFTPPGPRLDEASNAKLFSTIHSVAEATKQKMPADVFLVNDVNAWVTHRGGIMGVGSHRVMGVGLPLLQGLTVSELKAVLAHEFGHYEAGDVRLGPWIYKTRAAIGRAMHSLSESWLSWIFNAYGDLFMRLTLAISREQEFLADALGARVAHPTAMASALRRTSGLSSAFASYWESEVSPALEAGYLPPVASGFQQFLGAERVSKAIASAAEAEVSVGESSRYDTHPPLRERIDALNRIQVPPALPDNRPAVSLLDDADRNARELIAFTFGDQAQRLREVGWEQLSRELYPAGWRSTARRFAKFLGGYTVDTLPTDRQELARFGSSLPGGGTRSSDERVLMSAGVMASAVAVLLLDAGATLYTEPGRPYEFRVRGTSMDPFSELRRLVSGELSLAEWKARCHAMGIGGRSLAPGPTAVAGA